MINGDYHNMNLCSILVRWLTNMHAHAHARAHTHTHTHTNTWYTLCTQYAQYAQYAHSHHTHTPHMHSYHTHTRARVCVCITCIYMYSHECVGANWSRYCRCVQQAWYVSCTVGVPGMYVNHNSRGGGNFNVYGIEIWFAILLKNAHAQYIL